MKSPSVYYYRAVPRASNPAVHGADLVVVGGTAAGIMAAVQAAREGRRVLLAEFSGIPGGVTASGLGATDIGNKCAIGGLAREFYRRIGAHYGKEERWNFEPHVASAVFDAMLREAGVPLFTHCHPVAVRRKGDRLLGVEMEDGTRFEADAFLDCSYEGDLMALASVSHTVGREGNDRYGETLNGVHYGHRNHNFSVAVDPFIRPGDPASGLLPGISADDAGVQGEGDHRVQAYNFRLCLTNAPDRIPFPKPAVYDPLRYELLARYIDAGVFDALALSKQMPGGKTDTNNCGGFSTDHIGANHGWPRGDYLLREVIFQDHVAYTQGLLWFLANDPRVPADIRRRVSLWGLPRDEFPATGGFPHQLYVREARRMVSDAIVTEHHCRGNARADMPVGLAAYQMDSHSCKRALVAGRLTNEGCIEAAVPDPFGIPYASIVPRQGECANLWVPVCLSASHIAYGSIRMEPVFMALAQSAAIAAGIALDRGLAAQDVPGDLLQQRLQAVGQVTHWVPPATPPPETWPARVTI